jgi:alkylation response protein AidB-like acyl-CoA dehydrogenase
MVLLSADQAGPPQWLATADRLAQALRGTGAARDAAARPPQDEIALLREAGLLAIQAPVALGGGGATIVDMMRVVRRIAAGDSSIGQLLGYHYVLFTIACLRGTADQARAYAAGTTRHGWYWAGAVNPRDKDLVLSEAPSGFVLNGRKTFATGATLADRLMVRAKIGGRFVDAVIPASRDGFSGLGDWDCFGQRLTESGTVLFQDVFVAPDEILGAWPRPEAPVAPVMTLTTPMMQLNFVNFYLGTAEGALAEARDYVRETAKPWQTSGVERAADDPYILELFGQLHADLRASLALAEEAAALIDAALARGLAVTREERTEVAATVYAAKVNATRVALDVTSRAFELMGARATAGRYGFDRYWRNVRVHTLHDPVAYKAREVGNFLLNGQITPDPLYT